MQPDSTSAQAPGARYLQPLEGHPSVAALAAELAHRVTARRDLVERMFEFVRDEVAHSVDAGGGPVTRSPSDVLRARSGLCYAKSHLLVDLLRLSGVPAALCYQRLRLDGPDSGFSLHGLVAVWLPPHGWVRVDPRGNRPDIDARFGPPDDALAFLPQLPDEHDLPGLYARPLASVWTALGDGRSLDALCAALPDQPLDLRGLVVRWAGRSDDEALALAHLVGQDIPRASLRAAVAGGRAFAAYRPGATDPVGAALMLNGKHPTLRIRNDQPPAVEQALVAYTHGFQR